MRRRRKKPIRLSRRRCRRRRRGCAGDAMRDYAEGIDGRYGDPDGLLGWLGERADSAGQGLLSGAARILGVPGAGTAMDFLSTMENAAQQARENGAGEDEAFLYGLGEVVKRIGGQQLEEYFRSKAGELFTRGEVQAMSPREISAELRRDKGIHGLGFCRWGPGAAQP